jgi:hypothetical protein
MIRNCLAHFRHVLARRKQKVAERPAALAGTSAAFSQIRTARAEKKTSEEMDCCSTQNHVVPFRMSPNLLTSRGNVPPPKGPGTRLRKPPYTRRLLPAVWSMPLAALPRARPTRKSARKRRPEIDVSDDFVTLSPACSRRCSRTVFSMWGHPGAVSFLCPSQLDAVRFRQLFQRFPETVHAGLLIVKLL